MLGGKRGLYNRLNLGPNPSPATQDRITGFINETLEDLVSEPGMSQWLLQNSPPLTVASVANQDTYACPRAITRLDAVCDRTTNLKLAMMPFDEWRRRAPTPSLVTGTPSHWVPRGMQALAQPPAQAGGLWAVSSNASDTVPKVFVEAITSGGQPVTTAPTGTTLTGLSRVQLGSHTDLVSVSRFFLDGPCVGDISLYDAGVGGNLLATIAVDDTYSRYIGFSLYPTPTAAVTYYFDGEVNVPELSQMTDEPPIPARFHRILTDGALWRELDNLDDDRAAVARKKYEYAVGQLRYFVTCPPDFLPSRSGSVVEQSRLGPAFANGAGVR